MLKVGDRIRLVKKMGNFNFVGKEFKISSIDNDIIEFIGIIDMGWGVKGGISENEFKEYFEKVEFKKCSISINKWTNWIETKDGFSYKTDNVKYVRVRKDGVEVKASTHPCDIFNLAKGIGVCLQKIKDKKEIEQEEFENSKITYDSKFDILYIDFVEQPTYGYAEWIEKGIYLRKDSKTDEIIGIHIENFVKNHIKKYERLYD